MKNIKEKVKVIIKDDDGGIVSSYIVYNDDYTDSLLTQLCEDLCATFEYVDDDDYIDLTC